ncbi:hypothetical protein PANT111_170072 [Pantoea brenneri]|uniref:Transposase n=1 Tax=Pantoea brenneri TaxID=472694 RepID=A0AAX3J5G3_9GAMM|nr:hypothetical protein PANT111_170072 [Pantoea brenneri]
MAAARTRLPRRAHPKEQRAKSQQEFTADCYKKSDCARITATSMRSGEKTWMHWSYWLTVVRHHV